MLHPHHSFIAGKKNIYQTPINNRRFNQKTKYCNFSFEQVKQKKVLQRLPRQAKNILKKGK
jgi:hypothetical protein